MKKFAVDALIVVFLAFIIQWAFISYVPNIVYRIAVHRSGKTGNQWIHAGKTDAKLRRVVLPNPDFVYSALFYDLDGHDLNISGILPDSGYASISFYDNRCQPYYVYNNLSKEHAGKFQLKLSGKRTEAATEIHAKTNKGVIICRYLVKCDSSFSKMKDFQSQLACELK